MKILCYFLVCLVLIFGGLLAFFNKSGSTESIKTSSLNFAEDEHLPDVSMLDGNSIIMKGNWYSEDENDENLIYVVEKLSLSQENKSWEKVQLVIISGTNKIVYDEKFSEIERVYPIYALRTNNPQLVIEFNGGGQDNSIMVLDYRNEKISNLTQEEGKEMTFRSHVSVRPQFQKTVNTTKEPYQILLTPDGIAGSGEKYTNIFRYKNGQYRFWGKFSQDKLDDYIEKITDR
jgi:hypothetical protein